MELFFDTETSDKFNFKTQSYTDKNFPWIVQVGAILAEEGIVYDELNLIIAPEGRKISDGAMRVHQISNELAERVGVKESVVIDLFSALADKSDILVAHNFIFDISMIGALFHRNGYALRAEELVYEYKFCCTMEESTPICKLPGPYGWKWPKLSELYEFLFNEKMVGAHDAMYDIRATMKCYYELKKRGH